MTRRKATGISTHQTQHQQQRHTRKDRALLGKQWQLVANGEPLGDRALEHSIKRDMLLLWLHETTLADYNYITWVVNAYVDRLPKSEDPTINNKRIEEIKEAYSSLVEYRMDLWYPICCQAEFATTAGWFRFYKPRWLDNSCLHIYRKEPLKGEMHFCRPLAEE